MRNIITWFDVPTLDLDRAVNFYSEIFAEEVRVDTFMNQKLGFFLKEGVEGVGGALIPPGMGFTPSGEGTRIYFNCEGKLDEVLGRVKKAGGSIVREKFSIGEQGWIAVIMDTEGNTVGLHSSV